MNRALCAAILCACTLPACESEPAKTVMGGEFSTMKRCIETIEQDVGPLQIVVDNPDSVSGRTAAGNYFGCRLEETGTRGTFYKGWYEI